jgi:hypothetical protein
VEKLDFKTPHYKAGNRPDSHDHGNGGIIVYADSLTSGLLIE